VHSVDPVEKKKQHVSVAVTLQQDFGLPSGPDMHTDISFGETPSSDAAIDTCGTRSALFSASPDATVRSMLASDV
jgi:hypothetical protein